MPCLSASLHLYISTSLHQQYNAGYWSGYFTSRPTGKFAERRASAFLQTLRQASVAATAAALFEGNPLSEEDRKEMHRVERDLTAAVSLLNHHDSITGTEKQHVADDYMKILAKAQTAGEQLLAKLASKESKESKDFKETPPIIQASYCRTANESICEPTQSLTVGDSAQVLLYNPLPRSRSQWVDVLVNGDKNR